MGLDMYAFATTKDNVKHNGKEYLPYMEEHPSEEFFYWRKHPALHGWMFSRLLAKVNIKGDSLNEEEMTFNNSYLLLEKEDIEDLRKDLNDFNLPWDTSGFFFGSDNPQTLKMNKDEKKQFFKKMIEKDLDFVEKALHKIINEDKVILYYSSW